MIRPLRRVADIFCLLAYRILARRSRMAANRRWERRVAQTQKQADRALSRKESEIARLKSESQQATERHAAQIADLERRLNEGADYHKRQVRDLRWELESLESTVRLKEEEIELLAAVVARNLERVRAETDACSRNPPESP